MMGAADAAWATALRRTHFPPDRNFLDAHISLFHHLPPSLEAELQTRLRVAVDRSAPSATIDRLINLGRGVALHVHAPELLSIRADLADAFRGLMTPQDQAKPRLHITIQNKVSPEQARALIDAMTPDFRPRPLAIAGLAVWHYRGGPWSPIAAFRFRG